MFTLQTVGERFQRTVGLRSYGTGFLRVIEQGIHSFLQHTLLVAHDNVRSLDFHQAFQTVIADDDTTVEVVEVGGGETAAIQRHKRTQFRRNHRHCLHNHTLRTVVGALAAIAKRFEHVQTFEEIFLTLLRGLAVSAVTQFVRFSIQIHLAEQIIQRFCTHLGDELVGISII